MTFTYPALFHAIHEGGCRGGYFVKFPDLPGCVTQARSADEARTMAADVLAGWIEVAFDLGQALPVPSDASALTVNDGFVEMVTSDEVDPDAVAKWRAARKTAAV